MPGPVSQSYDGPQDDDERQPLPDWAFEDVDSLLDISSRDYLIKVAREAIVDANRCRARVKVLGVLLTVAGAKAGIGPEKLREAMQFAASKIGAGEVIKAEDLRSILWESPA